MRPFRALLSFEEAKNVIDKHIKPVKRTETIPIDDAVGRVLAADFAAKSDVPPFNRASMDGYAVRYEDTLGAGQFKPKMLKMTGEVHAGEALSIVVNGGECVQISTGAMLPEGVDAVVMVEDTDRDGDMIKVFKAVVPGSNIGKMGEDIKCGQTVLEKGIVLDAGKIGVLSSQGLTKVKVYAKPMISVLPTGEEVVEVGKKLKPGQLFDINSHTISALVKDNGGAPQRIGIAGDKIEELKAIIKEALKGDMVVLSGGSSVGTRDLLVDVVEGWGEVIFHGVQVKPGKPTLFAIIDGTPVMGMPGYPTSCLINSYLFLMPALRKMAQLPQKTRNTVEAKMSRRMPLSTGRRQFLTVRLDGDEAVPVFKESGAITSIAVADGYVELPENIDLIEKGDPVTVVLF